MTSGGLPMSSRARTPERRQETSTNLADILERVLDKGIVIAGDIRVNLLDIELLTIKIRLLVASVDKAKEMGIDWWEHDPTLSSGKSSGGLVEENRLLKERIAALEAGSAPELDGGAAPAGRSVVAPKDVVEPAPEVVEPAPEELVDAEEDEEPADTEDDEELVDADDEELVDDGEEPAAPEPEEAVEPAPPRRPQRRARRPVERRRRDDG
ncbi:gas vesicle protein [Pseudonocardia xinjiangensis]|uniref:gas vesicle protein n=1 Tax=Pseudonocardia xinjiangensis TaxID=75289 RepID=UPI003D8E66A8